MYEASEREKKKHANDRIQAKMFDYLKEEKNKWSQKARKQQKL